MIASKKDTAVKEKQIEMDSNDKVSAEERLREDTADLKATQDELLVAIIGALEATVFVQDEKKEPGNFGNPLPLVGNDYSDEMRSKELNNGRIAMFSAIGQIFAGLLTGKAGLEQFN